METGVAVLIYRASVSILQLIPPRGVESPEGNRARHAGAALPEREPPPWGLARRWVPSPTARGAGRCGDPASHGLRLPSPGDLSASAGQAGLGLLSPLLSNAHGGASGKAREAKFGFGHALPEQPSETSACPLRGGGGAGPGDAAALCGALRPRLFPMYPDLYETGGLCRSSGSAVVCGYLWKQAGTSPAVCLGGCGALLLELSLPVWEHPHPVVYGAHGVDEVCSVVYQPVGTVPHGTPEGLGSVPAPGTRRLPAGPRENRKPPPARVPRRDAAAGAEPALSRKLSSKPFLPFGIL